MRGLVQRVLRAKVTVAGEVVVSGVFCPVPNSTITRGNAGVTLAVATAMSLLAIGCPAGVVKSGAARTPHCEGSVLVRSKRHTLPFRSPPYTYLVVLSVEKLSAHPETRARPDGSVVPLDRWAVPRALRGESQGNVEYSLRRKDTGEEWFGSYSFSPIRGEAGAIAAPAAVMNAITNAIGSEHIDMPATPAAVWQAVKKSAPARAA